MTRWLLAEAWYPTVGTPCTFRFTRLWESEDREEQAAAKLLCSRCQAQAECLSAALRQHEPAGIWGGLTPNERARL